jgi:hypothetical protein
MRDGENTIMRAEIKIGNSIICLLRAQQNINQ